MFEGIYKLAGHTFKLCSLYQRVQNMFTDYQSSDACEFTIVSTREDLDCERAKSGAQKNVCDDYVETLAVYRKICEKLIESDVLLFHSSALILDGKGYLFTAPSGTGKSTHARLWREYFGERVVMINDDKPLLRFTQDSVFIHGTPYGGKEGIQNNVMAKLCGIVILEQTKTNFITPLTSKDSYPTLFTQSYRPSNIEGVYRVMELVMRLTELPVFKLGCTISQEAVTLAYENLTKEN